MRAVRRSCRSSSTAASLAAFFSAAASFFFFFNSALLSWRCSLAAALASVFSIAFAISRRRFASGVSLEETCTADAGAARFLEPPAATFFVAAGFAAGLAGAMAVPPAAAAAGSRTGGLLCRFGRPSALGAAAAPATGCGSPEVPESTSAVTWESSGTAGAPERPPAPLGGALRRGGIDDRTTGALRPGAPTLCLPPYTRASSRCRAQRSRRRTTPVRYWTQRR